MESIKNKSNNKRPLLFRIGKVFLYFLLSLIVLITLVLILIQTAPVQNFGRKKIVSFLENKLKTRVQINRLDIDFPKMLVLEGVFIGDKKNDTLIAGHQLKVDIDMYKLIKSEIQINEINLNGITAKVQRELPDTTFNFQFIVDAFAAPSQTKDTSAIQLAINKIIVDKTRLVYNDIVTGNDVDLYLNHFDTRIKTIDLAHLKYDVPSIVIDGIKGTIKQRKPIALTVVNTNPDSLVTNESPAFINFTNGATFLKNVDINYNNEVTALAGKISFTDLTIHPEKFDLKTSTINIHDVELNNLNGFVSIHKSSATPAVTLTTQSGKEINTDAMPWKVSFGSLKLNNNNFNYDDNTQPRLLKGMDYAHLGLKELTLHTSNFKMHNDTIALEIVAGKMKEKSGFKLDKLQGSVMYHDKGASIQNLFIKTPGSEIKRSITLKYPSLATIQKEMNLLELDVSINNSYLQVKDLLTFVPFLAAQPAFKNPETKLFVNSRVRGSINNLVIDKFQFHGLGNVNGDINGTISNAMDAKNAIANLNIKRLSVGRSDIFSFAPKGSIPANITIPETSTLTGTIRGGVNNLIANLGLNTSLGSASINGMVSNATDKINARYNATLSTTQLNVGALLQQQANVGVISGSFKISGKGYDPQKTNATIKGTLIAADIKKYTYRNMQIEAAIANQKFSANTSIKDPNIHLSLSAKGDIGTKFPGFIVEANIDSIKTHQLHLTPDPIFYRGRLTANVPQFNMAALNGEVNVFNSVLVMNGQRIEMDSITLTATHNNNEQIIGLKTDFVNATIQGQYKLEQLGDILIQSIQPYYKINTATTIKPVSPYDFVIEATVIDHPTLHGFLPELKRFDALTFSSSFSSSKGVEANLKVPYVLYGTNAIDNINMTAETKGNKLAIVASVNGLKSGTSIALYNTSIAATLANNMIDFGLLIKDKPGVNKYRINGLLSQENNNIYSLSLHPDSLLLNYNSWTINTDNKIRFGTTLVNAQNFNLSQGSQHLIINSINQLAESPLTIDFQNFQIATLSAFALSDSLPVSGLLNGNVVVRDIVKQPNFVTDLTLNNFSFKRDTIGDLNIKVNNNTQNVFATNVTISGRGNDINLTGDYFLKPGNNSNFKFKLNIKQLPFKTIETFSLGTISQSSGNLTGTVDISGTAAAPVFNGGISFNKTAFNVVMLGSTFKIDDETIMVDNDGILFDSFTIKDSANNKLVINGLAATNNFINYNFDLNVHARNFRAINTTKRQGNLYYGQFYFNTNLSISGTETAPIVDGSFKVNDNTNLSIVIPQAEASVVERKGVIQFVDMDAPGNDSIFRSIVAKYDSSFNKSSIIGFDVSTNIEVSKEAAFNIIIDEANGDFLKLKGEASLTGGIDPSGKITLTGTYEIESGGYELSFNFIRRKFDISKGSKITWTGEPTTAQIDITAIYIANTSPIELVINQISDPSQKGYYQQKLPFNVKLNVKGELMKPDLTFDIDLPKEGNLRVNNEVLSTVNTRLDQIKSEPSELNKQVFALLLLNRFVSDNPFQSSGSGGGFNATTYAKQSVSKILTEQLNKLATDLIAGVDINFDLNSEEDYSTGQRKDRTDFNVSLSKRLLNDRLKVSVGSNYELEGPQQGKQTGANLIGNLTIDYNLSQDGSYLLRGYRKNDYDYVLEGQVVETGLKFIISADYNKIKDLLRKKKTGNQTNSDKKKSIENNPPSAAHLPQNNEEKTPVAFVEKGLIADDRKLFYYTAKDSTNAK